MEYEVMMHRKKRKKDWVAYVLVLVLHAWVFVFVHGFVHVIVHVFMHV